MIVDLRPTGAASGMVFYSDQSQLTETVKYKLTNFVNWENSPPIRITIDEIPDGDGAYNPVRSYRGSKSEALEGFCYGSTSEQAVIDGQRSIAAVAPLGEQLTVTVTEDDGKIFTQNVWLFGTPLVIPFAPGKARFQIPLVATDPRKYAPQQKFTVGISGTSSDGMVWPLFASGYLDFGAFSPSGLFYITNNGTAESWPIFKSRGLINTGFQVISDVDVLHYTATVPLGTEVTLSPYSGGRATIIASDVTTNLTRSNWPSVKPGQTRGFVFTGDGSADQNALLTVLFNEASW
jgi:hypothetical protein